jgi:hypothetical protein
MTLELTQLTRRLRSRLAAAHRLLLDGDGVWDAGVRAGAAGCIHHADFRAWCAVHPGAACRVLVSGPLMHHLVCEPGIPLQSSDATAAYARQLFTHYHGQAAQRWPMAPWRSGERRGACALHGVDLAALRQTAAEHAVHLRSLTPWWSSVLPSVSRREPAWWQAAHATLFVVEGVSVTRVGWSEGRCISVQQHRLAQPTAQALDALCAEQCGADSHLPLALGHGLEGTALSSLRALAPLHGVPRAAWLHAGGVRG